MITGTFGWTLATGSLPARAVAVASDRGPVAAVFPDGSVRRYDPETGTSDFVGTAPSARLVTITPEGIVIAVRPDGLLSRWGPLLGAQPELIYLRASTTAIAVDGTGGKMLVGTDDGRVRPYDLADRHETGVPSYSSSPIGAFEPRPSLTGDRTIMDDDVRFTVYRPQVMSPRVWASLLVFAHKSDLVQEPGRPPVDPNEQVEARARAHFGDTVARPAAADAQRGIFRGTRLRIVPDLPGIRCNPEDAELGWWEPVHEVLFRLLAKGDLAGSVVRGAIRIWCGPLLLGEVSLAINIAASRSSATSPPVADSVQRYRKIFPSYSHDDRAVVEGFAEAARALGDQYLQDVLALRAGERWETRLLEFIGQADVFQLFWSSNSMRSRYCREEWEHALALARPSFIRPLYWEDPLPEDAAMGLPPVSLRELHFVKVRPYPAPRAARFSNIAAPQRSQGKPRLLREAPARRDSGWAARRTLLAAIVLAILVIDVVAVLVVLNVLR
ncbi:MAG: toll/interleukin-1 receptor domain-containing protein [Actinomycetota bacterium]|nr:toll/interleukin-1 receptor domain-containing protein [Actinomycetota bacterium]